MITKRALFRAAATVSIVAFSCIPAYQQEVWVLDSDPVGFIDDTGSSPGVLVFGDGLVAGNGPKEVANAFGWAWRPVLFSWPGGRWMIARLPILLHIGFARFNGSSQSINSISLEYDLFNVPQDLPFAVTERQKPSSWERGSSAS
jgi:hypothetical protein